MLWVPKSCNHYSLPSEDTDVGTTKKPYLSRNKITISWRRQVTMTCKMKRGLMTCDDEDEMERGEEVTWCAMPPIETQAFLNCLLFSKRFIYSYTWKLYPDLAGQPFGLGRSTWYLNKQVNKNTRTLGAGDYPALKFFFIFNYQTHVRFCLSK